MSSLLTRMVLGAREPRATLRPVLTPGYAYGVSAQNLAEVAGSEQSLEDPTTTPQYIPARERADTRVDAPDRREPTTPRQSRANRDVPAADQPIPQTPLGAVEPAVSRPAAPRSAVADATDAPMAEVSPVRTVTRATSRETDNAPSASPVRSANATALTPARMSVDPLRPAAPPPQALQTAGRTLREQRASQAAASPGSAQARSRPLHVTVSIGHIEVRAPAPPTKTRGFHPRLTLGDFLQGRSVRT
jgi:hypothetical protein